MERGGVFVIPLRVGGGTRLKVYEAMGMQIPIVSTAIGTEGLPVRAGSDVLIADTPEGFAREVVRLMREPAIGNRLASTAADRVRDEFAWSGVAARFAAVCERVAERRLGARETTGRGSNAAGTAWVRAAE